jgi:hypothetical protein
MGARGRGHRSIAPGGRGAIAISSARLKGARELDLTGQGAFDDVLGTAHLGILNSPVTWDHALDFLTDGKRHR